MAVPHSIHNEPGNVRINGDKCTNCLACARICPADVLEIVNGRVQVVEQTPFGCLACAHCMMVCPHTAITVNGRGLDPDDLVALPADDDKAMPEELSALMEGRRSVRHFTGEEIDAGTLEGIVEMAASAPMGIPPWDVGIVVVRGRPAVQKFAGQIIERYEKILKLFTPFKMAFMRPFMKRTTRESFQTFIIPLAKTLIDHRRRGRDTLFWDAPALMIFHASPYSDGADAFIACTYAMLAAESLGLGTTMIGSAAPVLARDKALMAEYGIPAGNKPAIVLILGHPAVRFKRGVRRQFTSVTTVGENGNPSKTSPAVD